MLVYYQHLQSLLYLLSPTGREPRFSRVLTSGVDLGSMKFMSITSYILNAYFHHLIH